MESVNVWVCEYANCCHRWMAQMTEPPRRCAKCKKCNWHKTPTVREVIRQANWQEQLLELAKPYLREQVKLVVAHEILEAKRRKGEYVAEVVTPHNAAVLTTEKCGYRQEDYETNRARLLWQDCGAQDGPRTLGVGRGTGLGVVS